MYVFSINQHWDGTERFDLCPVDFSKLENKNSSWEWKREYNYSSIGSECYLSKEEAWKIYNEKYSEENKKIYKEIREIRFIQEKDSKFI